MFDYNKTLLGQRNKRISMDNGNDMNDETRSMRSEFDYNEKKKFVDIIGAKKSGNHFRFESDKKELDQDFDKRS